MNMEMDGNEGVEALVQTREQKMQQVIDSLAKLSQRLEIAKGVPGLDTEVEDLSKTIEILNARLDQFAQQN